MPPITAYNPVKTTTRTDPIQKLLKTVPPTWICISGSSVPNTTPPAKMPTAIFVSTYATSEINESTQRAAAENRSSRNSGIV
jgi:hypothetical protein